MARRPSEIGGARVGDILYGVKYSSNRYFYKKTKLTYIEQSPRYPLEVNIRIHNDWRTYSIYKSQSGFTSTDSWYFKRNPQFGAETVINVLSENGNKINFFDTQKNKYIFDEWFDLVSATKSGFTAKNRYAIIRKGNLYNIVNDKGDFLLQEWVSSIKESQDKTSWICTTSATRSNEKDGTTYTVTCQVSKKYNKKELLEKKAES